MNKSVDWAWTTCVCPVCGEYRSSDTKTSSNYKEKTAIEGQGVDCITVYQHCIVCFVHVGT